MIKYKRRKNEQTIMMEKNTKNIKRINFKLIKKINKLFS